MVPSPGMGIGACTTERPNDPTRSGEAAKARTRDRAAVLPGPGIDDGVLGDIGAPASSPGVGVCGPGAMLVGGVGARA